MARKFANPLMRSPTYRWEEYEFSYAWVRLRRSKRWVWFALLGFVVGAWLGKR